MTSTPPRPKLVERLRARRDRHLRRGIIYRGAFVLAGFTVLLGGVAMLVLPGPALVVIPIGLAMLALEFAWAERLLERALEHAELAKEKAAKATARQRLLTALAVGLGVLAAITLVLLYDVPLLPV